MSNINLNQDMQTLEVGLKQATITGVLLHAGQNSKGEAIDYLAGTDTNVLEVTVPNGTKAIAQTILDGLKKRGYRYQPFTSERTVTDPTIEIGDNVTANGTKSVVMNYDITHSRLMAPTLRAPFDEEVNHEFKFETRSERNFRRESAYTRSRLSINADNIEAKVSKIDGNETSFGWRLESDHWDLFSNGTTVLHATKDGIEVKGKITATSGYIGTESAGFEIGSRFIRNGMLNLTDTTNNGVYIGTDGIALGKGAFKVSSSGAVTASNLTITGGSISIGDNFRVDSAGNLTASSGTFSGGVYAKNIKYGGDYGTMGGGGITAGSIGTGTGSPLSSIALGGISGGGFFNQMEAGTRPALIYGSTGSFTTSCNAPVGYFSSITDAHEVSHGTTWKSTKVLTSASAYPASYATINIDGSLVNVVRSIGNSNGDTTINYLGY